MLCVEQSQVDGQAREKAAFDCTEQQATNNEACIISSEPGQGCNNTPRLQTVLDMENIGDQILTIVINAIHLEGVSFFKTRLLGTSDKQ